jgi:hypothetical protein
LRDAGSGVSGGIEDLGFLDYDVYVAEIPEWLAQKDFGESLFNSCSILQKE